MQRLFELAREGGQSPDLIVGIATGGLLCAEKLKSSVDVPIMSCAMRRKSTATKKNNPLIKILACLPYAVTDVLRRYEDRNLEKKAKVSGVVAIPSAGPILLEDVSAIAKRVRAEGLKSVLVIDDAVDSGATLGCVMRVLAEHLPADTQIRSAVVSQTRPDPVYTPDLKLYYLVLCRFPWSFDYKGE